MARITSRRNTIDPFAGSTLSVFLGAIGSLLAGICITLLWLHSLLSPG